MEGTLNKNKIILVVNLFIFILITFILYFNAHFYWLYFQFIVLLQREKDLTPASRILQYSSLGTVP